MGSTSKVRFLIGFFVTIISAVVLLFTDLDSQLYSLYMRSEDISILCTFVEKMQEISPDTPIFSYPCKKRSGKREIPSDLLQLVVTEPADEHIYEISKLTNYDDDFVRWTIDFSKDPKWNGLELLKYSQQRQLHPSYFFVTLKLDDKLLIDGSSKIPVDFSLMEQISMSTRLGDHMDLNLFKTGAHEIEISATLGTTTLIQLVLYTIYPLPYDLSYPSTCQKHYVLKSN